MSHIPFLLFQLIGQFLFVFLSTGQKTSDLQQVVLVVCDVLWRTDAFTLTTPQFAPLRPLSHLYMLCFQDAQVLLHLGDAAGGLGHLSTLQVTLRKQLLDVLLLLLQGFLQRRGARYLTSVARRRLCQLRRTKRCFCWSGDAFMVRNTRGSRRKMIWVWSENSCDTRRPPLEGGR